MDNTHINIRIGTRHLQVIKGKWGFTFKQNPYHLLNKPKKFICVHNLFGWRPCNLFGWRPSE